MNNSLKRERLPQTIGRREKMFDVSSKESGTEQVFFWGGEGERRLLYTSVSGTHTFWTILKQCDNLGLSLQSYLGCMRSNPPLCRLEHVQAKQVVTSCVSRTVDNRQKALQLQFTFRQSISPNVYSMLQIIEKIQILNGNLNFFRMKYT